MWGNSGGPRGLPFTLCVCGVTLGGPGSWAHLGVLPCVRITLGSPGIWAHLGLSPCVGVTLGGPVAWAYLGIEHVDAEVAKGSLEKVVLGTILEERAVHGVGPHLQAQGGGQPEGRVTARHLGAAGN